MEVDGGEGGCGGEEVLSEMGTMETSEGGGIEEREIVESGLSEGWWTGLEEGLCEEINEGMKPDVVRDVKFHVRG